MNIYDVIIESLLEGYHYGGEQTRGFDKLKKAKESWGKSAKNPDQKRRTRKKRAHRFYKEKDKYQKVNDRYMKDLNNKLDYKTKEIFKKEKNKLPESLYNKVLNIICEGILDSLNEGGNAANKAKKNKFTDDLGRAIKSNDYYMRGSPRTNRSIGRAVLKQPDTGISKNAIRKVKVGGLPKKDI